MANPTVQVVITLFDDGTAEAKSRRFTADGNAVKEYEPEVLTGEDLGAAKLFIDSLMDDVETAAGEFKSPAAGGEPLKG